MRRPVLKTHDDLLNDLADQTLLILQEIDVHQKELKIAGRTSEADKYYRTLKLLKKWCSAMEYRY